MSKRSNILITGLTLSFVVLAQNDEEISDIAFNKISSPDVAKFLEWICDANKNNLCGGYYQEEPRFAIYENTPLPKQAPVTVTAKKTVLLSENGESELHGDVTISQPGREVVAQKVTFYRNAKTGSVTNGALFGNVHLREPGKLVVANTGNWDFTNKIITLNNAVYHTKATSPTGIVSAWGRAKEAVKNALGIWKLKNVTYTTCPPTITAWDLKSSRLTLNRDEGWGSSVNTLLFVKNVPVFYTPYFKFPIDKRRKSGFLYPALGHSSRSGTNFSAPYYFNLAPNYDFTLTPQYYSKRGLLTEGMFRYLTENSGGTFAAGYIANDSEFAKFRDTAPTKYPAGNAHALARLRDMDSSRGFVSLNNHSTLNQHWSTQLDVNYVKDDYFLQDFSNVPATRDNDQLLNQLNINYASRYWQFLGRLQAFQTLHPVNESPMPTDQYQRLPQLDLNGDFPNQAGGLNYQLNTEFVNFDHNHDFTTGQAVTVGQRVNLQPGVDLPLNWSSFYVDPKLQIPLTVYSLAPQTPLTKNNLTRGLPIFSVDSGVFFNREINFFKPYTQTLEPRIFYLFVPGHNQNDFPVFDTFLPAFNFEQLFRSNRFSGLDRIGDANQVAFAVTTRFLDDYTAEERLRASIGQIYQFHQHNICLNNDCSSDPLANNDWSPLVGDLEYHINNYWSTKGDVAWNPSDQRISTADFSLNYNREARYLFNLGYNFVRNGDPFPDKAANLNRINASVAWLLKERWHLIGSWNYNVSHSRPQIYLYGLQYDSCCWAVRLVQSRTFIVTDGVHNQFDNQVYLQFLLKGLGNTGTSDAGDVLTSSISGYQDDFASGMRM